MKAVVVGEKSEVLDKLSSVLAAGGIGVQNVESPQQFFRRLDEFRAAPIIVQWPLGEISGEAVVRRMRELFRAAAPIVVAGPLDDPRETVAALHAGADDVLHTASPPDLLLARMRAVMRRYAMLRAEWQAVRVGEYELDYGAQAVRLRGQPITLTPKEFDLLWVFANNLERLVPKAELMACVWGQLPDTETHTVSQHVHALRRKLRMEENGLKLAAVYGAGYRLERQVPVLEDVVGEEPAGMLI
jgi:DNA-binding response OmpR family regulator